MDNNDLSTMFSSASDEWETPIDFFDMLNVKYIFTLDPCATYQNAKVEHYFTVNDDGLSKSWAGETVFVNPPYSNVVAWVEKAFIETRLGNKTQVVMLLPSRTDTWWFHEYCMKADEIYFVKGRLKFGNSKNCAPFPSIVVVFNDGDEIGSLPLMDSLQRR